MKKILSLALAGLMSVAITGSAFAADGTTAKIKVKDLSGYQQLLDLRETGKSTRDQIRSEGQDIKGQVQAARQDKNKDALAGVRSLRPALKQLRVELKDLWTTQKGNWQAMKEARQAQDQTRMESILSQILSTRQAINDKLTQIKAVEDQIVQALQTTPVSPAE